MTCGRKWSLRAAWLSGLLAAALACGAETHPILPIGSAAPDFALPGVDGKIHRLDDYAASPVLVVVFTFNHCPIAQMYEQRIEQLYNDYRDRGVEVVAIQPNAPEALRIDELDSADSSDTLAEMKVRAAWKHLTYPYLYDGDTQSVARAYGPQATPHVFVFDRERRLRYEGRVDNSYRVEIVKTRDARNAIEAVLADRPVAVTDTHVFGCSTKWKEKEPERLAALRKLEEQPVTLETATAEDFKKLRANPEQKMRLVTFWGASCEACLEQAADFQTTYRMYSVRGFELVTVATSPDRAAVQRKLESLHATSRNLLAAPDAARAFDPAWDGRLPYTVLIDADGKVCFQHTGAVNMLELRRTILANMASDYEGFNRYWKTP